MASLSERGVIQFYMDDKKQTVRVSKLNSKQQKRILSRIEKLIKLHEERQKIADDVEVIAPEKLGRLEELGLL